MGKEITRKFKINFAGLDKTFECKMMDVTYPEGLIEDAEEELTINFYPPIETEHIFSIEIENKEQVEKLLQIVEDEIAHVEMLDRLDHEEYFKNSIETLNHILKLMKEAI